MNDTLRLIANRKSLRTYDQTPLSEEEINTIIKMGMRAPTAGNMMLYSILEISKQETKEKLAETCDHQPFIAKAPLILVFLADFQRWFDYYQHSKVPQYCLQHNRPFETPQESDLLLACCDALIAAQTSALAAESMGIGSCYIGDIMEQYETHRELLGLPDYVFPVTMLCFGKTKPSYLTQQPRPRFDPTFIHFKDRYRRLSAQEFNDMYKHLERGPDDPPYLQDAKNYGQHMYLKKTGAEFSQEMRRSVRKALESWCSKSSIF